MSQLSTSEQLIRDLQLQPHPEGGFYRECHRSAVLVQRSDGQQRHACTVIDFLLPAGVVSAWHRVLGADEIWHYSAGAPLELLRQQSGGVVETLELGPFPQPTWQLIKADKWQSARSLGDWSLVHCTVSPGFCFDDFELIAGDGRTDRRPTPQVG